ncbi:MAG: hypothetical protein IPI49_27625 [Myxococcales bacterium]|nr:hypothetical protein [Myxococcales bacterium]
MLALPLFVVSLVLSLGPSLAAAQGPPRGAKAAPPAASALVPAQDASQQASDDCARARAAGRQCVLSIEAIEVGGGVALPDGQVGAARRFDELGSLFRPRRDFIREILAAANDAP